MYNIAEADGHYEYVSIGDYSVVLRQYGPTKFYGDNNSYRTLLSSLIFNWKGAEMCSYGLLKDLQGESVHLPHINRELADVLYPTEAERVLIELEYNLHLPHYPDISLGPGRA